MQNFIVLGYIPGTHLQITFGSWLLLFGALVAISFWVRKRQQIRYWLTFARIAFDLKLHPLK